MGDPFGSMNGFLSQFQGFLQNPMRFFMSRKMGLSQDALQNPQAAIQQMLNSGQMSQAQFNQLRNMADRIQRDPMFSQIFSK